MINQLVYEAINNQCKIKLGKYNSKFHSTIPENPNHSISLDDHKNKHTILVNGKKAGIVAVKDLSHPFWQIRIHPDHRGTGLLEKSAHALAKKYNKKELVATINKDNIASTKSHSNAGFTRDHEKEKSLSEKGLLNPENHLYSKKF